MFSLHRKRASSAQFLSISLMLSIITIFVVWGAGHILEIKQGLVTFAAPKQIQVILSSRDTNDRLSPKNFVQFKDDVSSDSELTLTVDCAQSYQEIIGFGGAITEAASFTISQLSKELQEDILEAYYGPSGHKYTLGRVPINSCDYSLESYSFCDTPGDYELETFDMKVTRDSKWVIPFLQKAIQRTKSQNSTLTLYASPWSPPAWMKSNGRMTGSDTPGLIQDPKIFRAWAKYFTKWIEAYKGYDISFWGVTVQNEPQFAAPWEACTFSVTDELQFVKNYLGPELKAYDPNLKIIIYDHNKQDCPLWANTIFGDAQASKYVDGIGVHWYDGDHFESLAKVHDNWPNKFILPTEATVCPGVALDDWSRGELYGHDIMGDLNNYAIGWTDWNIVLNTDGGPNHLDNYCDAMIIADTDRQEIHYQPMYWYMGHFSRFLPPGSIRIGLTNSTETELEATAFRTPSNQIVVIVMNRSEREIDFKLRIATTTQAAQMSIPYHSIATLLLQ